MWFAVLIAALCAYLLGNLNGAVCMSNLIAKEDVRSHGSGNAGLTNFIRNYGANRALFVVFIDAGKAVIGCFAAGLILKPYGFYQEGLMLGGMCVILGHVFPALLGFHGGKGILSGWFVAWVVDWRIALILVAVFGAAYLLTHYVSLGSVLAALSFSLSFVLLHHQQPILMGMGIFSGLLCVYMHRGNISRLMKGEERKTNLLGKGKQQ